MHARSLILVAAIAALTATAADAQMRRITPVPQATRQAAPAGVTTFATPSPSGLASPNPAQLTPPTVANIASPGTAPGSAAIDAGIAQPVTGGGGGVVVVQTGGLSGGPSGTNVMGGAPSFAGPPSAADIARGFIEGDINHDSSLSRDEAQRVGISLVRFDELDRNHDGLLSRFEYDDNFR